MSTPIDKAILKQKQKIIEAMVSYMKYGGAEDEADEEYDPDFDAGYTQENIDQCDSILLDFLDNVQAHSGAQASVIMNDVKTLVLALNALNEKCDYTIIETDQREDICALIGDAANKAGLTLQDDATDQWREW